MPPDDEKARLTRDWLIKAEHDLIAAERANAPPPVRDVLAFHCQQAVEKALKAFLTWKDRPFTRTHNLLTLVEQCEAVANEFAELREAAQVLTPYAVEFRYPSGVMEPTREAADAALDLARQAVDFVVAHLPPSVRP